jgi:hypothetical protein
VADSGGCQNASVSPGMKIAASHSPGGGKGGKSLGTSEGE